MRGRGTITDCFQKPQKSCTPKIQVHWGPGSCWGRWLRITWILLSTYQGTRVQTRLCPSWGSPGSPGSSRLLQGLETLVPVAGCDWSHLSRPFTCAPEPCSLQSPRRGSATSFPSETPNYFSLRHNKSQTPWEPAVQHRFIETNNSSCNPCFE